MNKASVTFFLLAIMFILICASSCGGGRYHRSTVIDCKVRGLTYDQCTDEYYKKTERPDYYRYKSPENRAMSRSY